MQGDQITEINGQEVAGMRLREACDLIRRPAGTQVKITVRRMGLLRSFTLTRELLNLDP